MGLIKSQQAPPNIRPFSMKDVEEAARMMLLRAKKQADDLLAAAQREGEELKEVARAEGSREGFEQGRKTGLEQGKAAGQQQALQEHRQQLADVLAALTTAAAEIDAHRHDLETEALREVVQLAAAIARRVTKRQGLVDDEVLAANVNDAMRLVVASSDVRIAVHPSQLESLNAALPQLRVEWPAFQHVELVEDAALAPGGCRLFTRGGRVDADLDGQLDRVIAELLPGGEEDDRVTR